MDDRSFHRILDYFNLSRRGYRKIRKGVKKRLSKHLQQLGCSRVEDYLAVLSRRPDRKNECRMLLTVSISRFFRDRSLWETLEKEILPEMTAGPKAVFRLWSCGCARGEEVYSFKIVWDRLEQLQTNLPDPVVWGTDMNPEYLKMARRGAYTISSLKELRDDQIERYFDKVPGKQRYVIKPFLRQAVRFEHLDITRRSPPSTGFDMIFVRNNLLTYYRSPEKERCLEKILRTLLSGGILITGSHEKIPENFDCLQSYPDHPWIWSKRDESS